jgi:hypothetical protein
VIADLLPAAAARSVGSDQGLSRTFTALSSFFWTADLV